MVKPISPAPRKAAGMGGSPSSTWRLMFSIITMASSTTKPVAIVRAIRVRLFSEKPNMYIAPKVPTRARGTAMPAMAVAAKFCRNTKMTATTSTTASISSSSTSWTEARIVLVRSVITATCTPGGMDCLSCGSSACTRSTTLMTLAPGWRWMFRITAGVITLFWPIEAPSWVFSAL